MLHDMLALASGGFIGLMLGVVGGGGSILAVPLLLYLVGIKDPHVAIGTSAVAVSANAFANLATHARAGTVKWPCAATFAISGFAGAYWGAEFGRMIDSRKLLLMFSAIMLAVAIAMTLSKSEQGNPRVHLTAKIAVRLVPIGLVTGLVAGFFGIGGGFLIVPGIMFASGMPIINAIGSSLFAVGILGVATAINYAQAGLVDWRLSALLIGGGIVGGIGGQRLAVRLSAEKSLLSRIFAAILVVIAVYMAARTLGYAS